MQVSIQNELFIALSENNELLSKISAAAIAKIIEISKIKNSIDIILQLIQTILQLENNNFVDNKGINMNNTHVIEGILRTIEELTANNLNTQKLIKISNLQQSLQLNREERRKRSGHQKIRENWK